jgi:hypothetical protein
MKKEKETPKPKVWAKAEFAKLNAERQAKFTSGETRIGHQ